MPPNAHHQSQSPIVILLGGPGAGKGTQGRALAEALGYQHFSSGEHLRDHARQPTPLGRRARESGETGQLVSDDVAIGLVRAMLSGSSDARGFVMDGYPRSLVQAEALERIAAARDYTVSQTLYLEISDDEMLRRLSGRLTCRACGQTCHVTSQSPTRAGVCDACGGELFRRADDEPVTIKKRIAVFHRMIDPLLEFYRESGRLSEIAAEGAAPTVSARVIEAAVVR